RSKRDWSADVCSADLDFRREQQRFLSEKGIESNNDLIFLSLSDYRLAQLGKPISQRTMNDAMKELCKKANVKSNGLPLTCYTLRSEERRAEIESKYRW